jgi:arylsulfatase A-like enzyme
MSDARGASEPARRQLPFFSVSVLERAWLRAAGRGAAIGVFTGAVASAADLLSMRLAHSLPHGPVSTLGALVSLLLPLLALTFALAALWAHWVIRLLQRSARSSSSVWLASGLLTLPLTLGAMWVPLDWLTEHWSALRVTHKAIAIVIYCGLLGAGAIAGRALLWSRDYYAAAGSGLPRAHWVLLVASAAAAALAYWLDLTRYVDLYDHFHYGLAGAFIVSTGTCTGLLRLAIDHRPATNGARRHSTGVARACLTGALAACGIWLVVHETSIRDPRALVFSKAVLGLQHASDWDDDGHATIFGSADCAPLDRSRSPSEIDIPGNGVDEDCNGADASRWPKPAMPRHYDIPKLRGLNVLLVTVDALRADRLSVYGNRRNTSPRIDRLAREGILFAHAYAQASTTYNSLPSLFTGLYPTNLPRDYHSARARSQKRHVYTLTEEAPLVTELLKARGYVTHAVTTIGLLKNLGLDRGFDVYDKTSVDVRKAKQVTSKANAFLASAKQPFFLWLHYDEPHDPYETHSEYHFGNSDLDIYDGEIAAADTQIGLVLDQLDRSNLAEKTLVVLTADHGEEFREHGGQYHAEKLYRELLHVPLLLRAPGLAPREERQMVELVDVLPTLCEALELHENCASFDGQSLWATLAGQRDEGFGFRGAYAEVMMRAGVLQRRSLLTDEYRFNVYSDAQVQWLFDVRADPSERNDVAVSRPAALSSMQDQMALRPYRRLGPLFEQARSGDSAGLLDALPRIRSESMLRFALDAIAEHPCPGAKVALQRLTLRAGLSAEMIETVSERASKLPR